MSMFKLIRSLIALPALVACSSTLDSAPPPGTVTGATALIVPSPGAIATPRPMPTPIAPSTHLMTSQAFSSILAGGNTRNRDGIGESARFFGIKAMVLDLDGNILVADSGMNAIRKVTMAGEVITIAGNGNYGKSDGKAEEATFRRPTGIAIDSIGNMYVADTDNDRLRKITTDGDVLTLTRTRGWYASPEDGLQYDIDGPKYIIAAKNGDVFVSAYDRQIYRVTPEGQISVHFDVNSGIKDRTWFEPIAFRPGTMVFAPDNRLMFADEGNERIWRIGDDGVAERFLGNVTDGSGFMDGDRSVARNGEVKGMAFDPEGNLYFNDTSKRSVRMLSKDGQVRTLIGDGINGDILGIPTEARLGGLEGLVYGRDGHLYVGEPGNGRILKVRLR